MTDSWHVFSVFIGGVATLAVFSYLIRENEFYRFFEHVFIGIAAGLGMVLAVKNFLWPELLKPMLGLDIIIYPDGTWSKPYNAWLLLYSIPMLFGLFYYFIYSQRYSWLAKLVIGFSLGASGGLAFKGFFNEMLPQVFTSFKPLVVFGEGGIDWGTSLSNTVFVVTLLTVMYYFFFAIRAENVASRAANKLGRYLMMICFGAFFGSTVMARMALLVERLEFLIQQWLPVTAQTLVSLVHK